ncbi:hypothetical protein I302_106074 [Kwoniella bestiolae CBS 10118]|uniref:Uncharacterized protein n=1 Tax=Kwoniella bestiolae CBS 10118 TaxID=1296100 RepID=A0AAJ8KA00_9TREE
MAEPSSTSNNSDTPIAELYKAYPYHGRHSTRAEQTEQKSFLDTYGKYNIGGRKLSDIISEVNGKFSKIKDAIDSAMQTQARTGEFVLSLNDAPSLKALPVIADFIRDKQVRKRLKRKMNSMRVPNTVSFRPMTAEMLGPDYDDIYQGLSKLKGSVLRRDLLKNPGQALSYLAAEYFPEEAQPFFDTCDRDKRWGEWELNVELAQAAAGKELERARIADLMSDDLMRDLNASLPRQADPFSKSTSRQWDKPSEYLILDDPDLKGFREDVNKEKEEKKVASLDPSALSRCMSKYPALKRKVTTILAGFGSHLVDNSHTEEGSNRPRTVAQHWRDLSYLKFAVSRIQMKGSQDMENLSEGDLLDMLPQRASAEYLQLRTNGSAPE